MYVQGEDYYITTNQLPAGPELNCANGSQGTAVGIILHDDEPALTQDNVHTDGAWHLKLPPKCVTLVKNAFAKTQKLARCACHLRKHDHRFAHLAGMPEGLPDGVMPIPVFDASFVFKFSKKAQQQFRRHNLQMPESITLHRHQVLPCHIPQ